MYDDDDARIIELADLPGWRARFVLDEVPAEPENDGQMPILRVDYGYGYTPSVDHVMTGSYTDPDRDARIEEAFRHFAGETEKWERYLRIMWGVTKVEQGSHRYAQSGPTYYCYDPEGWREAVGCPADWAAQWPTMDNLNEWISYVSGDVWGIVVEREVTSRRLATPWVEARQADVDGLPDPVEEEVTAWEEVESVWGFYTEDPERGYTAEEAREMIRAAAEVAAS